MPHGVLCGHPSTALRDGSREPAGSRAILGGPGRRSVTKTSVVDPERVTCGPTGPGRAWGSGQRGLRLGYVDVDAVEQRLVLGGGVERVVLVLDPYELGFQVLDALLKPSHLGEESRVGTADVTEKRLCHDAWSSTLSDRPMRCGSYGNRTRGVRQCSVSTAVPLSPALPNS